MVTDVIEFSDLELSARLRQRRVSRRDWIRRNGSDVSQTAVASTQASASLEYLPRETGAEAITLDTRCCVVRSGEGGSASLHRSLAAVTPENYPRIARLLASSTREAAQKFIEGAGEFALEAVKHHAAGIVRESAGLLFYVAGFSLALVSDAKTSRTKACVGHANPAARARANVIPFPSSSRHSPT